MSRVCILECTLSIRFLPLWVLSTPESKAEFFQVGYATEVRNAWQNSRFQYWWTFLMIVVWLAGILHMSTSRIIQLCTRMFTQTHTCILSSAHAHTRNNTHAHTCSNNTPTHSQQHTNISFTLTTTNSPPTTITTTTTTTPHHTHTHLTW